MGVKLGLSYSERNVGLESDKFPPRLERSHPTSELLRSVRWFDTDVSELPIGPTGSPEASVSNYITLLNNSEDFTRLRVFENRVLRKIFGPKGDEVTEG